MLLTNGTTAIYVTAVSIGMLHGLEPGHGWPIAAVFALRQRNRWWYGIWAALILAVAHLTSSFAVVGAYALANHFLNFHQAHWMNFVAGGLLILMGAHQWRSGGHHHDHHHHDHGDEDGGAVPRSDRLASGTLLGLAGFAFALGFAHEEEFAIIALAAGRASPWLVMAVYASAVSLSLVLLTCLAIATLNRFEQRLGRYQHYLPRVSAVILAVMGLAYIFRLI